MIMVLYDPPIQPTKKTLHLHIQLQISSDLSEHNKIANTQDYNNNHNMRELIDPSTHYNCYATPFTNQSQNFRSKLLAQNKCTLQTPSAPNAPYNTQWIFGLTLNTGHIEGKSTFLKMRHCLTTEASVPNLATLLFKMLVFSQNEHRSENSHMLTFI